MPSGVLILNIEGCHCKQGSRIKELDIMKKKLICRHKECVQMLLYCTVEIDFIFKISMIWSTICLLSVQRREVCYIFFQKEGVMRFFIPGSFQERGPECL
jgi:hypothetical protein